MTAPRLYKSRSSAVRAARNHCKRIFGPFYQAYEGPDYEIHPRTQDFDQFYYYRLRGPAKEIDEGRATHKDGYLIPKEGT